jgi:hypothetical protein
MKCKLGSTGGSHRGEWVNRDVLVHFTYTPSLAQFGAKFHQICHEIFEGTPLEDIPVTYAHRLTDNLPKILVHKKTTKECYQAFTTVE